MKRNSILILLVATLMAVGCQQRSHTETAFQRQHLDGHKYYSGTVDDADSLFVEYNYYIEWPIDGTLPDATMRELIIRCFEDSISTDVAQAANNRVETIFYPLPSALQVSDSAEKDRQYEKFIDVITCQQDSDLVLFSVEHYIYFVGAAHGNAFSTFITIDLSSGSVVEIEDLMDTTQLGRRLPQALHEVDDNGELRTIVFPETLEMEQLPPAAGFYIDREHRCLAFEYDAYDIAAYAYGRPVLVMPFDWLVAQGVLTAYGKRLMRLD